MSDWRNGQVSPFVGAMAGPTVAGMAPRLGVWLVDWLIFILVGVGLGVLSLVTGSLAENPEAARQLLADPAAQPTVPLLSIKLEEVLAIAAVWVVVVVVYPAICWNRFRRLPGQRIASLEVADAVSGANLSLLRSLLRSVALNGPPAAAIAVMVVASVDMMATVPSSTYGGDSQELSRLVLTSRWSVLLSLASMTLWVWLPALLVSSAATFRRRGLHDRVGRSVVVRVSRLPYLWPGTAGPMPYYGNWRPGPAPGTGPRAAPDGSTPAHQAGQPQLPAEEEPRPDWLTDERPAGGRTGGVMRAATMGRRVTAYLLDGLFVFGVYQLAFSLVAGPAAGSDAPIPERDLIIVVLGAGAAQCAYFVATWFLFGGTLGQRSVGLLVVRETGERLGPLDGLARWAVLQGPLALVAAIPTSLVAPIVITVWAAMLMSSVRADGQGRGYHDRIAGSRVILQR